jgi:hypothetical protein
MKLTWGLTDTLYLTAFVAIAVTAVFSPAAAFIASSLVLWSTHH